MHICQSLLHNLARNQDDPSFSSHQETFVCVIRGIILAFIVLSVMHEILRLRKHFLRADNYNAITTMIWFNNKNEDHFLSI